MRHQYLVYTGSYTRPITLGTGELVAGVGDGITVFLMDESGRLTRKFAYDAPNPTYLAFGKDQHALYAVNEQKECQGMASSCVSAYSVNGKTGELALINRRMTGGEDACNVCVAGGGKCLLVANYSGGSLAMYPINPDDSIGVPTCFFRHTGSGPLSSRQAQAHVHQVMPDQAGRYVLAADLGTDTIAVYKADYEKGFLIPQPAAAISTPPGSGPRQFVFNQKGDRLYLITELGNTICVFSYDTVTGHARMLQELSTLPEKCQAESIAACIRIHPTEKYLYASNRGYDSIAIYRFNEDGTLELSKIEQLSGRAPRDFNISPDGAYLVCGFQDTNELIVYHINQEDGHLSEVSKIDCGAVTAVLFREAAE